MEKHPYIDTNVGLDVYSRRSRLGNLDSLVRNTVLHEIRVEVWNLSGKAFRWTHAETLIQ